MNKFFYLAISLLTTLSLLSCHEHNHSHSEGEEHEHFSIFHFGHNHAEEHDDDVDDHEHKHEHEAGEIVMTDEQIKAAGIATETVAMGEFTKVIKVGGQIVSSSTSETQIVAPISGTVYFASNVSPDKSVVNGERLFTISNNQIASGDPLAQARIEYENAKSEFERISLLVDDKIVTQREYQAAKARLESAKIEYDAINSKTSNGGVGVKSLSKGYIRQLYVANGAYVEQGTPLATIVNSRELILRADVPQRKYGSIGAITGANFTLPSCDSLHCLKDMQGKLLSLGKQVDANSHYIPVTFSFSGMSCVLSGSYADVYLLGDKRSNVISVPKEALTEEQGLYFVYIQKDEDAFQKQEVRIGASDGARIEILSGLSVGDNVVVSGVYQVKLAATSSVVPEGHHHH